MAFSTRYGLYEYLVMSFGLTNVLTHFMFLINSMLMPELDKSIVVFNDDILVYSKSMEEHEEHLRIVLQQLREHELYAKLIKCMFWLDKVPFLGHEIRNHGGPQQDTRCVEWQPPKYVHQVCTPKYFKVHQDFKTNH
jgi:hypothetical protein